MNDVITNILICGIGGQGVMTAAEILAQAAMAQGFDCKKSEIAGMAQRGGVVTSHVRFGRKVWSPVITPGTADLLVAFEVAEGSRWADHLRPGGTAMVNTIRLAPPIVSSGLYKYPADPVAQMRAAGVPVIEVDAGTIARDLGNLRLVNTIMLGAIADHLPFPATELEEQIVGRFRERKPAMVEVNQRAFEAGRQASQRGNADVTARAVNC
ncbi:indolepyruvate oxidoreductase subunit beta [Magnetospirillum molischianum]|uniref:Pyruvate:ferredoxin oxidoreductase and related 2-oxoacid:ferredoxin oxidoreductase, gamma subunit n=1 Tax=Magnetospirillum molischianum DSM 120 TaxID=1150626 RepID=H8FSK5_MAGML|nr:indolepyruvate oxidoreductase subunit beta [Magnetospirillum molischianum]CCG41343.1 Pyruvate:ferredoxin oxidoreductase and related 2-oxoacid:ferredoxin oxidoreductase, gamma subunit [Magnetospirillum molischianum DSM 120]